MRDRLIELMCKVKCKGDEDFGNCPYRSNGRCSKVQRLEMCSLFAIVDHLLDEGVIVPPCKLGQTVYVLQLREIYECRVNEICISAGNNNVVVLDRFINGFLIRRYGAEYFNAFGKTVFLTKEEAEKALAERNENGK